MDGISAAMTIVALIQTVGTVTGLVYNTTMTFKNARERRISVLQELESLLRVLNQVLENLDTDQIEGEDKNERLVGTQAVERCAYV